MKTLNPKLVKNQLNKCYLEYDPEWRHNFQEERIYSFKDYMECTAGLKLDFIPKRDTFGRYGYELQQVDVVDESKYLMWLMRWA